MLAAFLRRYPTNNMLKKLRAKFVKEHGEEEAEKLLAKEETEIEQALDLYVLRGYYSWSAMMVSLKDGHVYEYCADSQHTLPRSRFIRRETLRAMASPDARPQQLAGATRRRISGRAREARYSARQIFDVDQRGLFEPLV
jgi:hypothetical protein